MTAYRNFIEDFPGRCRDILKIAIKPTYLRGREVTLLLMVASAGLIIPYERLKPDGKGSGSIGHPSRDNMLYTDAARQLHQLLEKPFLSSDLWNEPSLGSWERGYIQQIAGSPESWPELDNSKHL